MATHTVACKPILFSAPMVKALLEGRKTQTRRIVKLENGLWRDTGARVMIDPSIDWQREVMVADCPYGSVGHQLWVRETFFCATGEPGPTLCHYRADYENDEFAGLWRPSIHMPRWASRITLELTDVRVERLQDIGRDGRKAHDVLAEGIDQQLIENQRKWFHQDDAPALAFAQLWESINGAGSWAANPFVWVIGFRRLQ